MTLPTSESVTACELTGERASAFPLEPYTLETAEAIMLPCGVNVEGSNAHLIALLEIVGRAASSDGSPLTPGVPGAPHVRSVILDLRSTAHVSERAYAMMHHLRRQCGRVDITVFAIPPEEGSPLMRMWKAINGWFFPPPPPSLVSRAVPILEPKPDAPESAA